MVKAALLLFRDTTSAKELLFARATGKPYYVFPGGKQEPGESIEQALQRELREELATGAREVKKLGEVEGATPDGRPLHMHLYTAELIGQPRPSSEIEELRWLTREAALREHAAMTPMTLEHVFPFLSNHGLW